MAGFKNHRDIIRAHNEGRVFRSTFRKNPSGATQAQQWVDLTRHAGNPGPFYYASAPMTFAATSQSTHGGIRHGNPVAPATKHLSRLAWIPYYNLTASGQLLDILGYVPFVPEDDPGTNMPVDFAAAKPARWGTGEDVVMYLEIAAPGTGIGGNTVVVGYTNSKGVAGRETMPGYMQTSVLTNGSILLLSSGSLGSTTMPNGPFFCLQNGDDGIESVQYVRVIGVGDVGLFTLVFARVVADFPAHSGGLSGWPLGWSEVEFGGKGSPMMPVVDDDAFLSILFQVTHTALALVLGQADFIWSD